jgi:creatinine amidohydrolase
MTWEEVRDLNPGETVAVLPLGAIEAHGPHLPIGTDTVIARGMVERAEDLLQRIGWRVLVLPPLAFTPAGFAAGFPGTLGVRPETLEALLVDVADGLTRQGFRALAIANAHLDPAHLAALHAAVDVGPLPIVFPDLTRRPWGSRLGAEFKSGACHAGRFEGSVVLAERREWVRQEIARELPALEVSLAAAIREGKPTFEEAGLDRAYCGDPAAATADEGRETIETLGRILADAVIEAGVVAVPEP